MRITSIVTSLLFAAATVTAQTPPGAHPGTKTNLGVAFNGTAVTPGILLPTESVQSKPIIYSPTNYSETYMILMVDLLIPYSRLPEGTDTEYLVPGLYPNRTTRLHWWGGNYTHSNTTKLFTNSSDAIAAYGGPAPPAGDIPHDYVEYLFLQPEGYVPPAQVGGELYPSSGTNRFNFSVTELAAEVGRPLAANWFQSQAVS